MFLPVRSSDIVFDPDCETFKLTKKTLTDQASVMPRLIGNKIQPLLYGETFRMRTDVMKDFQDTAEKQEQRWLIKFGKDVLADLHGVCPIVVLAAQEFYDKQDKLMETSSKIPPVPLNFQPEVPEHYGHETIMLTAGKSGEHIVRPEVVICAGTRLRFALNKRLTDGGVFCRARGLQLKRRFLTCFPLAEEEPMWKDADVIGTKNEILDYIKGLSNWPMCLIGDPGSGRTSLLAQVSPT